MASLLQRFGCRVCFIMPNYTLLKLYGLMTYQDGCIYSNGVVIVKYQYRFVFASLAVGEMLSIYFTYACTYMHITLSGSVRHGRAQ
ncbi:hypothetical protein F5Y17DRAFT_416217 [Xylariaceae sp. FL0594]|nr:hypothetical protein F5Y17DRAFT_416217 [Xylariaceae sp. FL0594]